MIYDSDGNLTEFGISKVASLTKQYELARKEVQNYSKDMANLNDLYDEGQYTNEEYKEKLAELQSGLLDSAKSMKSYSDGIVDMYKDIAQAELDSLFEVIDLRSEALSKKKEYYDFDKTIRGKTKDIKSLEAQVAALENVNTAEAKVQRAKLNAELTEAREDLDDTINNHVLEISQDSLNDLKETLQEAFDERFKNLPADLKGISDILKSANDLVGDNTSNINDSLTTLLKHYGINKIEESYAKGTKSVPRNLNALTNENGKEIIVTKHGMITPLEKGDGVVPNDLTERLYKLAQSDLSIIPRVQIPKFEIPDIDISAISQPTVTQNFDSLIHIDGSADAATVKDLKALAKDKDFLESAYKYFDKKAYSGYIRAGGKRRV